MKAVFIFLAPDVDPLIHRSVVKTPKVELTSIAVNDYEEAAKVANELVRDGVEAIELCGGFGHLGTARVVEAVAGRAKLGVVRFDGHPGLENRSGDDIF